MQRIIEKTLERNIPADELHLKRYYERCRVFAISGFKEEVRSESKVNELTAKEKKNLAKKDKKKGIVRTEVVTEESKILEPEDPGNVVFELFESSNVDFIPASIACVGKEDLCLCLFATDIYYRKQAYGTKLMNSLKEIYKGNKLHLYVRSDNEVAVKFYKFNGWVEVRVEENYYWDTLNDGDAIVMELQC